MCCIFFKSCHVCYLIVVFGRSCLALCDHIIGEEGDGYLALLWFVTYVLLPWFIVLPIGVTDNLLSAIQPERWRGN